MNIYGKALDELAPVPTEVIKLFMLESAFSKWVPPDPSVAFCPVSSKLASCWAKLVIVEPVRLLVRPTAQELLLLLLAVQRFWMNGNNATANSLATPLLVSVVLAVDSNVVTA